MSPRFLPFADIATPDLPLRRLIRLSLFQVSVGMGLVLLVGTLNRVMIVELDVAASLVGIMVALPVLFAPLRALIGYKSDVHQSALGWRRTPFIWKGSLYQFGGFAIMPFALLVLAGKGESGTLPLWIGHGAAALAFLMVGAGLHTVQTAGLALATDLTPQQSHPRVVGMMYVMLLAGMGVSALLFGAALTNFTPGRLVQVVQAAAVLTLVLNLIALWKQEVRIPREERLQPREEPGFREAWAAFSRGSADNNVLLQLTLVGLGTLAFGMADILLEPYGGEVLALNVASTTRLTAWFAVGGLFGFMTATLIIARGGDPIRTARNGALLGIAGFAAVVASAPLQLPGLFLCGNILIGFCAALFSHGTLTATMITAPPNQAGMALGAWGAVQATAAGIAMALSGVGRDLVSWLLSARESIWLISSEADGYLVVYGIEIVLLAVTAGVSIALVGRLRPQTPAMAIRS
ncbi:MAG: BCD family MFS transporter [Pseudomonadota bacterium]